MFIQRLANRFGYVIVRLRRWQELARLANYKPSENVLAEHLRRIFHRHRIEAVLDVGANDGAYALMLRNEAGYEGAIHSFEPIPEKFRQLRERAKDDNLWEVYGFALGATSGRLKLNVMKSDVFSSFHLPFESQPEKYSDSNCVSSVIEVEVRTVSDEIKRLGLSKVHLKMDTQGFDLEVFEGACPALSKIATLQSELSFRQIYKDAPGWKTAVELFSGAGFKLSFLMPISLEEDLGCIEADGVFVTVGDQV